MKLGLAVLMIAVSAYGQTAPKADCTHGGNGPFPSNCSAPKPHKPKPSVKKDAFHMTDGGDPIPEGVEWHVLHFEDEPCDDWACTKPIEMLPQHECGATPDECWRLRKGIDADTFYRALGGLETITNQQPDKAAVLPQPEWCIEDCRPLQLANGKAAVPVEHKCDQCDFGVEPFRTQIVSWPNGAFVIETEKQIMALLPPDEYSHLEQLRASVVDEEKRLAKKYGASVPDCSRFFGSRMYFNTPHGVSTSFTCMGPGTGDMRWPTFAIDDYQFHGQFLLIQKGKDPNVISLDGDTK